MDSRIDKLAKLLIHYSLKLKKGQLLKIQGEISTLPLIKAAFKEAVAVGAQPFTKIIIPENEETFLKHASDKQLRYISPVARAEINKMDALLVIWGSQNTRGLSGVKPKRQALSRRYMKPLINKLHKRIDDNSISWCGTLFPTNAEAQEADMSLSDWEDFVYGAGRIGTADPVKYWKKIEKEQNRLVKILNRFKTLHFLSADTDLKMNIKGRKWINCAGTENFPDGEIFTGPVEDSVEGHIHFTYPAVYMGRVVEDVRLEFKKGKVVKESASKDQAFLTSMLNIDKGARFVGEIAVGTNYNIKHFSKNILFDEKIGGTIHLAVGMSFPECGSKNSSVLHWDMICNMKKGEIVADGKVIYRNGKFTI
ncbi:MAG: aminopeptidase [candidate division Zixibacteria bacterium]|nr:aminopeptidase [candidate division Zixibacteria bacterium]